MEGTVAQGKVARHFDQLIYELKERREKCGTSDEDRAAGRELSMAITDLENAWTHANAATYYKAGTYNRSDADVLNPGVWD